MYVTSTNKSIQSDDWRTCRDGRVSALVWLGSIASPSIGATRATTRAGPLTPIPIRCRLAGAASLRPRCPYCFCLVSSVHDAIWLSDDEWR